MTEDAKPQAYRGGIFESWLRRCGERPGRTFLMCWVVLLVCWLVFGFVSFKPTHWPDVPPKLNEVPYQWFEDSAASTGYQIQFDADVKSTFSGVIPSNVIGHQADMTRPKDQPRLLALLKTREFSLGWPSTILVSRRATAWDVTQPCEPFGRATGFWRPYLLFDLDHVQIGRAHDQGTSLSTYEIVFFPLLCMTLLTQFVSAVIVAVVWAGFGIRQRRRARLKLCLVCGYARGPMPDGATCAECGSGVHSMAIDAFPRKQRSRRIARRPCALYVVVLALLCVTYVIASLSVPDIVTHDIRDQLQKMLEQSGTLTQAVIIPRHRSFSTEFRSYGFVPVVTVTSSRSYEVYSGITWPQLMPAGSGGTWYWRPPHHSFERYMAADPVTTAVVEISLPMLLWALLGLEITALAGLTVLLLGIRILWPRDTCVGNSLVCSSPG